MLRKFQSQAARKINYQDTHSQVDPVRLIKERERILGTKAVLVGYHLVMKEVTMMTVIVVRRNQTDGSLGILNLIKK